MKKRKAKPGRRPLPAGKAKSVLIVFRAEPALHTQIAQAAEQSGKTLTGWIRDNLTQILRSE